LLNFEILFCLFVSNQLLDVTYINYGFNHILPKATLIILYNDDGLRNWSAQYENLHI